MLNDKPLKGKWVVLSLLLALSLWCVGCGSSSDGTATQGDDFVLTTDIPGREEALRLLLPKETYNIITAESLNNDECREHNRAELGLGALPNGQWYYTYNNMIAGMAEMEEFASEGADENTNKLEIAAFLANVAQETGAKVDGDPYGSPGCFIQEGAGSAASWVNPDYGGLAPTGKGYIGRGPHQLSWDVNYEAFGETMGVGSAYLEDPDILTTDPDVGIAGSIWFWGHEERTAYSPENIPFKPSAHNVLVGNWVPTTESTPGVRTSNDVECDRAEANFGVIINLINGGRECGPNATAEGLVNAQNRVRYLQAIAEAMGVTVPDGFLDDCSTQWNFSECTSY